MKITLNLSIIRLNRVNLFGYLTKIQFLQHTRKRMSVELKGVEIFDVTVQNFFLPFSAKKKFNLRIGSRRKYILRKKEINFP